MPSTFSIVLLSTVLLSYFVTLTEVRHRLGINLPPVQLIHAVLDLLHRTALNLPPNLLCHPVLNLLHRPGINLPPVLLRHPFLVLYSVLVCTCTQSLYVFVLSPCMYLYSVSSFTIFIFFFLSYYVFFSVSYIVFCLLSHQPCRIFPHPPSSPP